MGQLIYARTPLETTRIIYIYPKRGSTAKGIHRSLNRAIKQSIFNLSTEVLHFYDRIDL